jgi:hypothetical protein
MDSNQSEKNKYQQLKLKIGTIKEDLKFLKRCERSNVIPNFIDRNIQCSIKNERTILLLMKMKKMWVKLEKLQLYTKLNKIEQFLYSPYLKLTRNLYSEELRAEWIFLHVCFEDVISTKVAKEIAVKDKKFSTLLRQQSSNQNRNPIILTDFVINQSSYTFTEKETNILNRGLNFAIRPKAPPLVDIIASIKSGIQHLPDNVKLDVRNGVKKIIKRENETHHNNRFTEDHRYHVVDIMRE